MSMNVIELVQQYTVTLSEPLHNKTNNLTIGPAKILIRVCVVRSIDTFLIHPTKTYWTVWVSRLLFVIVESQNVGFEHRLILNTCSFLFHVLEVRVKHIELWWTCTCIFSKPVVSVSNESSSLVTPIKDILGFVYRHSLNIHAQLSRWTRILVLSFQSIRCLLFSS